MSENATISANSSNVGSSLMEIMVCGDLEPGSDVSYQMAKTIYLWHPLGAKMVEAPISMAMSQDRKITIPGSPESMVRDAFNKEWEALGADKHIFNVKRLSRIYGVSSIIYGAVGVPTDRPIDPRELYNLDLYFNVLDPLNTAGSLVLNQDPNAPDFQKHAAITVAGQLYHRSRSCTILNEEPIYIGYTNTAFGYVGRSVYQRALFPLKSFIQSMITDDMVTRKAGLLIAKQKAAGSIVDNLMANLAGIKRSYLKEGGTGNVLSIDIDESIETLDMKNADTAMTAARKNIIDNIAAATPMPAKILNSETFAEGFGEGTEDAKDVIRYVQGVRNEMQPLYAFFDPIVMRRAWNPEFYKTVQAMFPEYEKVPYIKAYYDWVNAFQAQWPSLHEEPESEKIKVDETKFKSVIAMLEVLIPQLDPENKATLIEWAQDAFSSQKTLFPYPLNLDIDALKDWVPPIPAEEPKEPKPFSGES